MSMAHFHSTSIPIQIMMEKKLLDFFLHVWNRNAIPAFVIDCDRFIGRFDISIAFRDNWNDFQIVTPNVGVLFVY